ncbi:hypothetical protein [Pedobacter xixiisoli]|uniref:Uncharacterized protein n=1 Tax=Pedobacter xixiisoli TaxID=1476464 RepID=A0A285ZSD5_9SPHI|nr:hypothetical protein [Pedobacter xixiisoli]SOD12574.1 hypothetical protein SAMN06297358_0739 [Pedobacter xixiisoli]
MENKKKYIEEEDINNPEQFQARRSNKSENEEDDSKYTQQENEFADGKGSNLAEAFKIENSNESKQDNQDEDE